MTSHIWTIKDVRYLRESPSTPLIKRNDASLAVFSYTCAHISPLVFSIMGHCRVFFTTPQGVSSEFSFVAPVVHEHEMQDDDRKRHRTCRDSVVGSRIARPIVSRLGAASLRPASKRVKDARPYKDSSLPFCATLQSASVSSRSSPSRVSFARGWHLAASPSIHNAITLDRDKIESLDPGAARSFTRLRPRERHARDQVQFVRTVKP